MRRFVLNTLYPIALSGLPVLGKPQDAAAEARRTVGGRAEQAERLVRRHIALCGAAGFVSGLGGWITLPFVLPANIAGVALVQLHMAASVAALGGKDPAQPDVKRRVVDCLVGAAQQGTEDENREAEQEAVDRFGIKLAERGLNFVISNAAGAAVWASKKVGGRLQRRIIRGVPVLGGVIGAVSDGFVTTQVARAAIETFIDEGGLPAQPLRLPSSGDGLPEDFPLPARPSAT